MGHLCHLQEKGRKGIEEIVEGMKEDREENGTGIKVKKQNRNILLLSLPATRIYLYLLQGYTFTCYKDIPLPATRIAGLAQL